MEKSIQMALPYCHGRYIALFIVMSFFMLCFQPLQSDAAISAGDLQTIQRQQDNIIQQQEERLRRQEEEFRQGLGKTPSESQPEPLPRLEEQKGAPCLEVKEIKVSGSTLLGARKLRKIVMSYENQCLSLTGINNLLRDITNAYIEKGYVTSRAFIDTNQETEGILQIMVVEGTIEKIILNDGDRNKYYQGKAAFPGLSGKALNLRDIEQGLDQLNRLPSNNAVMELEPGSELGGTIVKVYTPDSRTWRGSARLDNLGQRNTGKTQYSLSFEKDNYIGLGDQVAVYWTEDTPFWERSFRSGEEIGRNNSLSGYVSFPIGYWTIYANASISKYHTTIFGEHNNYKSNGETASGSIQLERVIHRNANSKSSASLALNFRDTNTYIEKIYLESSSYSLATLEASISHSRRIFGGVSSLRLGYTRGVPWFGAGDDLSSGPSAPKSKFDKYSATLSWYKPFAIGEERFYWNAMAHGQISPQTLYGAERISIGGRSSVRGFHEETITGDKGFYLRNELGWNAPWFKSLQKSSTMYGLQVYTAYDYGYIKKDRRDLYERGSMQGIAAGVRSMGDLNFDITYSRALKAPDFINKRAHEIYAVFSYNI